MEKIYGYKQEDLLGLAEFIKSRKNKTLSKVFAEYALVTGKAKGTVRNMYYALVKVCETDDSVMREYFSDFKVKVNKIVEFKDCEVRALIRAVLNGKKDNRSARSVVMELANNDVKLALRYQNKYRSVLKTDPELVNEIAKSLNIDDLNGDKKKQKPVSDFQLNKLKKEIDGLVERISERALKENQKLKARILALEAENIRLTKSLYSSNAVDAITLLRKNTDMVN